MRAADSSVEHAYQYALSVVDRLLATLEEFPTATDHGSWRTEPHGDWGAGSWIGLVWLRHLGRPSDHIMGEARRWLALLAPRQFDVDAPDLGLRFEPSFVRGFNLTADRLIRTIALQATRSLAGQFHESARVVGTVVDAEARLVASSIETVASLPLLAWGGDITADDWLLALARRSADAIIQRHLRPDGATYELLDIDLDTGDVVDFRSEFAHAPEGCWARGQAWAIMGLTKLGAILGEPRLLRAAQRAADYFIDQLPRDNVPFWDLSLPSTDDEPRDSSAAAIAASGLLDLAMCAPDVAARDRYHEAAEAILRALIDECLAEGVPGQSGILLNGTYCRRRREGVDESNIHGDHYFVEALLKWRRPEQRHLLDVVGARLSEAAQNP
jgi:unsaturated chondroitin disaccharide hydrolase